MSTTCAPLFNTKKLVMNLHKQTVCIVVVASEHGHGMIGVNDVRSIFLYTLHTWFIRLFIYLFIFVTLIM